MALWQLIHFGTCTVHHVPNCVSCHKAIMVITGKTNFYFQDFQTPPQPCSIKYKTDSDNIEIDKNNNNNKNNITQQSVINNINNKNSNDNNNSDDNSDDSDNNNYIIIMIAFFKLHMVIICKQKNLQLFIHAYNNTLRSRAYYSRRFYQSSPV